MKRGSTMPRPINRDPGEFVNFLPVKGINAPTSHIQHLGHAHNLNQAALFGASVKVTGDSLHQEIFASTEPLASISTKEAAMKLKQIANKLHTKK